MAERTLDLQRVETYWLLVSHHFEGLLIDLSLFDFREGEKPKVLQGVKREVPVERAYDEVMMLLDEYYRGKDILWRPSFYLFKIVWKAMHEAKKDFPNFVSRKPKR